ncbi:MAG: hypothetical protein IT287_06555 [Bdellovibrionaceae bacterium]|nr:hypothetical protein [Pseudobdellovibrionaceae bacterium]
MAKNTKDQPAELINEILAEADPTFLKELDSIDPTVLNGREIEEIPLGGADEAPGTGAYHRHWVSKPTSFKIIVACAGFIIGVALPLLTMSFFGWFTPEFKEEDGYSLTPYVDETFTVTSGEGQDNLFKVFPILVFAIEIPEKVYPFNPKEKILYGKFSFYVEVATSDDADAYEKRIDTVTEAISNVIRRTHAREWLGTGGKERIRVLLLVEINKTMSVPAKTVRFKSIFI